MVKIPKTCPKWLPTLFYYLSKRGVPMPVTFKGMTNTTQEYWDDFHIENNPQTKPKEKKPKDPSKTLKKALEEFQEVLPTLGKKGGKEVSEKFREQLEDLPQQMKDAFGLNITNGVANMKLEEDKQNSKPTRGRGRPKKTSTESPKPKTTRKKSSKDDEENNGDNTVEKELVKKELFEEAKDIKKSFQENAQKKKLSKEDPTVLNFEQLYNIVEVALNQGQNNNNNTIDYENENMEEIGQQYEENSGESQAEEVDEEEAEEEEKRFRRKKVHRVDVNIDA